MEKTLFLHWGPGGNAQAELKQFSSRFPPNFVWWDQPAVQPESAHPYQEILDSALSTLDRIYSENQAPVKLVGHSFGAQLAIDLGLKAPEKVSRLVLIAALPSVQKGYEHLGYSLARHYHDIHIKNATQAFAKAPSFENFVPLVQAVTKYPDFMAHYWGTTPESIQARDLFFKFGETQPILNFDVFLTVMKDLLDSKLLNQTVPKLDLPVEIHLGNQDPYFDLKDATEEWKRKVPQAKVIAHPAGHFVHLESSIEWV